MKDYVKKYIQNEKNYKIILNEMYFNEARNEREIFELWHYGENNCNIAKKLNISEGTVRNRKKDIMERSKETMRARYDVFI